MIFKTVNILLILVFNCCHSTSEYNIPQELIADVPVHDGYSEKYSFKDHHYLDICLIPSQNLEYWLAITLEKSLTDGYKIALQTYNGKDFSYIESEDSFADIGYCKKINCLSYKDISFLVVSGCSISSNMTQIIVVDDVKLSLTKLQDIPHPFVQDAQFWINHDTDELNLIILSRHKLGPRKPGLLYHYVYKSDSTLFEFNGVVKNIDPRSLTVFNLNNTTYVAVANYQDLTGNWIKSLIYIQDKQTGQLTKYQELTSRGAISFTHFCFVGNTKKEYFLLSSNNLHLRGPPGLKNKPLNKHLIEESILFKWDDGYFVPFQTILARVPSAWIAVPSDSNVLVLITWSYIDKLVSYQYDGWKFRRTTIPQTNVTIDPPKFAHLQIVPISGENLFTFFIYKEGAKRKYFITPKYQSSIKTRKSINEKEVWCKNMNAELQLAWNIFSPHYQYLSYLSPTRDSNPEERIISLFSLLFGYNKKDEGMINGMEIMSLKGSPPYFYEERTNEHSHCKVTIKTAFLPSIEHIIPVENGFMTLNQSTSESAVIKFYPLSQWKELEDPSKGEKLYKFKFVTKITNFQSLKLCNNSGIYIEGWQNGELWGNIYSIHKNNLIQQKRLRLKSMSKVLPVCFNRSDCFLIKTLQKDDTKCFFQCQGVNNQIDLSCDANFQLRTILWNNHSILIGTSNNTIFQIIFEDSGDVKLKTLKETESPSKLYIETSDHAFVVLIVKGSEAEICRSNENNILEITCNKASNIPYNYKYITLDLVNEDITSFIGTTNTIFINKLSSNDLMIVDKIGQIKYDSFKYFKIKNLSFLLFKDRSDSTIVNFKYC